MIEGVLIRLREKMEADEEFSGRLFAIETAEEAKKFLEENGIELSVRELEDIKALMVKVAEKENGKELSDEEMDGIAGGFIYQRVLPPGIDPYERLCRQNITNMKW